MPTFTKLLIVYGLAFFGSGCGSSHLSDDAGTVVDGGDVPRDTLMLDVRPRRDAVSDINITSVDLLFMIDNSGGMREAQSSLAMQIPRLLETLATGMPAVGAQFPPVRDLRVGVISSDMGVGGHMVATCGEPNFGDDGILRSGCGVEPPPRYLSFRPADGEDVGVFSRDVACLANTGTSGCGFEQPLDALLKAITPSSSPVGFIYSTRGHAGLENGDFVRRNSLLAIVVLTDEDDCSASDPDLFNRGSSMFPGDNLSLRCFQYGAPEFNAVYPIQRYVDGFLDVHSANQLMFAAIVGIPPDLAPDAAEAPHYREILSDPRMVEMPADDGPSLVPSCDTPGRRAHPPRRIVQVAQGLEEQGVQTVVQSICQSDYTVAIDAIVMRIGNALR